MSGRISAQQIKYAVARIDQIAQELSDKAGRGGPGSEKLTGKERCGALKSGQFRMKPGVTEVGPYSDIKDVIEFTGEIENTKRLEAFNKIRDAKREKIWARANTLKDELMLGDAAHALSMLKQFEQETFT